MLPSLPSPAHVTVPLSSHPLSLWDGSGHHQIKRQPANPPWNPTTHWLLCAHWPRKLPSTLPRFPLDSTYWFSGPSSTFEQLHLCLALLVLINRYSPEFILALCWNCPDLQPCSSFLSRTIRTTLTRHSGHVSLSISSSKFVPYFGPGDYCSPHCLNQI